MCAHMQHIGMHGYDTLCRCMRERVHVLYVCILAPLFTLCGSVSGDSDLFLSRLINEEIKVSVSQSRHRHREGGSDTQLVPLKF